MYLPVYQKCNYSQLQLGLGATGRKEFFLLRKSLRYMDKYSTVFLTCKIQGENKFGTNVWIG